MCSLLERLRGDAVRDEGVHFQLVLERKTMGHLSGWKGNVSGRVYVCRSGFFNVDVYSLYTTHSFLDKTSCHVTVHSRRRFSRAASRQQVKTSK
jgi:hypothetical protein